MSAPVVVQLCSEALCTGEATHRMPHLRLRGATVWLCKAHHAAIVAAAAAGGVRPALLRIEAVRP